MFFGIHFMKMILNTRLDTKWRILFHPFLYHIMIIPAFMHKYISRTTHILHLQPVEAVLDVLYAMEASTAVLAQLNTILFFYF